MNTPAFALLLILATGIAGADNLPLYKQVPPELKAIQARYDLKLLGTNNALREKYINELAQLRWRLAREGREDWLVVDAEIARHPAPVDTDDKALSQLFVGTWHSPRHDYLVRADGTWLMDPTPGASDFDFTHGTWAFRGNHYITDIAADPDRQLSYAVILLNADNFIYADPVTGGVFYEKRSLDGGWPLRRDDPVP